MALEGYYKMNTGFTDSSGKGRDGINNGVTLDTVNQKLGAGCGSGDGLNDKITFSSFWDPSSVTKFSFDGWIKSDAAVRTQDGLMGWWQSGLGPAIYLNEFGAENLLVIISTAQYAYYNFDHHTAWIYFACVYDGSLAQADRMKIYINGTRVTPTVNLITASTLGIVSSPPELFNLQTLNWYYKGLADDLAIYSHALNQSYITQRWNGGAGWEITENGIILPRRGLGRGLNRGLGRGL